MSSSFTKIKVGFTTFLAIFILFTGMLWVKQYNPLKAKTLYRVMFRDANGVASGDPVTIAGITVGHVTDVILDESNSAIVTFRVDSDIPIHPDFNSIIQDVGLMGDKALVIEPGKAQGLITPDRIYQGAESVSMNAILKSAEEIMTNLSGLSERLNRDLDIERLMNTYDETLANIREVADIYTRIAEDNSGEIEQVMTGVARSTENLNNFITSADERLENAFASFEQTSAELTDVLRTVNAITDTVHVHMEDNDSTLSKLVRSDALYEDLRRTNLELESFIVDFRENPGKYTDKVNFKIRLF